MWPLPTESKTKEVPLTEVAATAKGVHFGLKNPKQIVIFLVVEGKVGILNTYFNSIETRFKPFVFHRLHAMQQKYPI